MRGNRSKVAAVVAAFAAVLAITACGSDSNDNGSSSTGGTADVASATQAVAPYIGKPSPFPVTEPLNKIPAGSKVAFMDCGTPICALFWQIIEPAGKTMGIDISRVQAGSSADTVSSAFDTVVSQKPDGVIVTSIDPRLWQSQLKQLQDANIPVVSTGIVDAADFGIKSPQYAQPESERDGALMADYVAANLGADSKVAFYDVPELTFTGVVGEAFTAELGKVCPDCAVRTVHIPVATIGNTAPNQIVSDLQANPDTTVAAFATDEVETGLPAALNTAGIKVKTIGNSPGPTNLQYLKDGQETVALGVDLPVLTWTLVDQMAREITGQELGGDEAKGLTDVQFLTQKDIVFDPSQGWTGYPDFAQRFAKLWGVGG
jgi:ribose transport system substrate-binding protein